MKKSFLKSLIIGLISMSIPVTCFGIWLLVDYKANTIRLAITMVLSLSLLVLPAVGFYFDYLSKHLFRVTPDDELDAEVKSEQIKHWIESKTDHSLDNPFKN